MSNSFWTKGAFWAVAAPSFISLLAVVVSIGLGYLSNKSASEADDAGNEALAKLERLFIVSGEAVGAAQLIRDFEELQSDANEPLWRWYAESKLTVRAVFKNSSAIEASIEKVELFNSDGDLVHSVSFLGEEDEPRVRANGSLQIPLDASEIAADAFDDRLGEVACSLVPQSDVWTCNEEETLEVSALVRITPIGGEAVEDDFSITIRHRISGDCQVAGLLVKVAPAEGCPREESPTPSPGN